MFDEMVVSSPNPKKTNKPWTVVLSMFQGFFGGVDFDSSDLYRGAAEDDDGDVAGRSSATSATSAASASRRWCM